MSQNTNFSQARSDSTVEPLFDSQDGAVANVLALGNKYSGKKSELTSGDIQAIMKAHNDLRERYGVQPLAWDQGLANIAERWANTCYWGHWKANACSEVDPKTDLCKCLNSNGNINTCEPRRTTKGLLGSDYFPPPRRMGENLSVWKDPGSTVLAGQYGTQLWLNEEKDFDCQTGQCVPGRMCGHWTQMAWADTKRVGCALRTCDDGTDPRSWPSSTQGVRGVQYLVCEYDPPGNFQGERPFPLANCSQPGLPEAGAPGAAKRQPPITVDKDVKQGPGPQQPTIAPPAPPPPPRNVIRRDQPGAGMIAMDENMSTVPEFFQGLGRTNRQIGQRLPPRAKAFIPEGIELVQLSKEERAAAQAEPEPIENRKTTPNSGAAARIEENQDQSAINETAIARPAPEPPMTRSAPPSNTARVATVSSGALLGGAALGAAIGAAFFYLTDKNKSET